MKKIVIISGPTASGKTETSLRLAECLLKRKIAASIVNFDSLLFYRELNIGTAKPNEKQRKLVEHHLVDIDSIKKPLDASDFIRLAVPLIEKLHQQGKIVILTGGSGFYLRALFKGMYPLTTTKKIKKQLETLYKEKGIAQVRKLLEKNDPSSFQAIHKNDHYRIIRATEYCLSSGKAISQEKKKMDENLPFDLHKNIRPKWDFFHCHLDIPKKEHFEIIKKRTEKMLEEGLIEEVCDLLKKGFSGCEHPLQSVGHKQVLEYAKGNLSITSLTEAINLKTRRLAKAQRTFFKKIPNKNIYHGIHDQEKIIFDIVDFIKSPANVIKNGLHAQH